MKCAVIKVSELGSRWDAGFHLLRKEYESRTASLARVVSAEEAVAFLLNEDAFSTEDLRAASPLVRGNFNGPAPRAALIRAIEEYPHLALAVVLEQATSILQTKQKELQRKLDALDSVASSIADLALAMAATPESPVVEQDTSLGAVLKPLQDVGAIPDEFLPLLKTHRYVAGVVHDDGDALVIPVHTSKTDWVSDCWIISKDEWAGLRTLQDLVADGNVPLPRRFDELGQPVGYLELPGHEQNYETGWR